MKKIFALTHTDTEHDGHMLGGRAHKHDVSHNQIGAAARCCLQGCVRLPASVTKLPRLTMSEAGVAHAQLSWVTYARVSKKTREVERADLIMTQLCASKH